MSETDVCSTFGPYEVVSELGRGSMAVVWRCYDPMLNRFVAIKELLIPEHASVKVVEEFKERFAREAQAVGKLDHPSIVPVYAAGVWDGRAGIVMQLIDGELLSLRIRRGGLPFALVTSVIDELLGAVSYAHGQGVIHRDLKPDNIFVTNSGRIRLTDFGVAHIGFMPDKTTAGTMLGTPAYMAPEQMDGKPIDVRADLFSIGVIAYILLTGVSPFQREGDSITAVIRNVTLEQPPSPHELKPTLPRNLSDAVMKALEKNRENRFDSAEEMRKAWNSREKSTVPSPPEVTLLEPVQFMEPTLLEIEDAELTMLELPSEDTSLPPSVDQGGESQIELPLEDARPRGAGIRRWRRAVVMVALSAVLLVGAAIAAISLRSRGHVADSPQPAVANTVTTSTAEATSPSAAGLETQTPEPAPTVLTARASDDSVRRGTKVKISTRLLSQGEYISGATVIIEWSRDRKSWKRLARGVTTKGAYSYSWKPSGSGYFRARFAGTDELQGCMSDSHKMTVKVAVAPKPSVAPVTVKKRAPATKSPSNSGGSDFVETR